MDDEAIAKIFEAKGRPSDNPLIVHIGTKSQLDGIVKEIPPVAEKLMAHFGGTINNYFAEKRRDFREGDGRT